MAAAFLTCHSIIASKSSDPNSNSSYSSSKRKSRVIGDPMEVELFEEISGFIEVTTSIDNTPNNHSYGGDRS